MTRLCDLTNDNDTVTSVSWAERGNFVAVGTHRGYVQVFLASSFKKSHRSKTLRNYFLKVKNPEDVQFTTSSRRLDGGAYCGALVGGKCMVSKAKLVLYAFAV